MEAVHRLTRKVPDEEVPVEVMAMDIFRVARTVYNDPNIRGNKRRQKVIHDRIHALYPDADEQKFIAALTYLSKFYRDDD